MAILGLFQNTTDIETFSPGQVIFNKGDAGTLMYVVKQGEVELQIDNWPLTTVGEGGIIGEMALIDDEARSLTAMAKTECQLVPIDQKRFGFLVQQTPFFALEVMKIMANRLRAMNQPSGHADNRGQVLDNGRDRNTGRGKRRDPFPRRKFQLEIVSRRGW